MHFFSIYVKVVQYFIGPLTHLSRNSLFCTVFKFSPSTLSCYCTIRRTRQILSLIHSVCVWIYILSNFNFKVIFCTRESPTFFLKKNPLLLIGKENVLATPMEVVMVLKICLTVRKIVKQLVLLLPKWIHQEQDRLCGSNLHFAKTLHFCHLMAHNVRLTCQSIHSIPLQVCIEFYDIEYKM